MVHGPGDVPQLRRFIEDSGAEPSQKAIEHGKLDALIGFTEASTCRRQVLLGHFGESLAQPCGNCDVCLEPDRSQDVTEAARKALSAVYRSGSRFGAAHLVDVLLGANSEKIRVLGHQELSVYGIGKELDRGQWRSLFRQLVATGLLISDPAHQGGLRFGDRERVTPLLRGEVSLELRLPLAKRERQKGSEAGASRRLGSASAGGGGDGDGASEADPQLLQALKDWRREQARSQGVPPYVVFHDRTLMELASRRPPDLASLAGVTGVGKAKLASYGEAVLALLATGAA
jgi:ATP-dependent DNA helicase RecQ